VERAIGDSQESLHVVAVRVFAVALKQRQGRDEVPLLEEVVCVGQLERFLLGSDPLLTALAATATFIGLLERLIAEPGLIILPF